MDEEIIRKLIENVVIEPGPWIFQFSATQFIPLYFCKNTTAPYTGRRAMASHFMEGTSILSKPALLHLNALLLMVMQVAASGCLNMFACFSWHALLSASILFSAALLISSFNSSHHITNASSSPATMFFYVWPATMFFSFPMLHNLPSGFSSLPSSQKEGWMGQRPQWW